jgi:hypothetical protein
MGVRALLELLPGGGVCLAFATDEHAQVSEVAVRQPGGPGMLLLDHLLLDRNGVRFDISEKLIQFLNLAPGETRTAVVMIEYKARLLACGRDQSSLASYRIEYEGDRFGILEVEG